MSRYFVFVKKGKIRDFDDIYEGMVPEAISSADQLKSILGEKLNLNRWEILENRKLIGKSSTENIEVTIDAIGEKEARMITANGISQLVADELMSQLDLSELE